ncbi:hypothetical protein P7F88_06010 [Vibrio hannami]|uniref:hypothetical protein n=1 Tax=Vibrio hannami TaxID=2717094 RepID=UPI002410ACFA|nr:hypothetical protein [Vibrio hannami]MDG3085678.1 hypothetical protein [Vibrio hannami]
MAIDNHNVELKSQEDRLILPVPDTKYLSDASQLKGVAESISFPQTTSDVF